MTPPDKTPSVKWQRIGWWLLIALWVYGWLCAMAIPNFVEAALCGGGMVMGYFALRHLDRKDAR
jgi:hypothetical protein